MKLSNRKFFKLSAVAVLVCGSLSQVMASGANVTIKHGDAIVEAIDSAVSYGSLSIVGKQKQASYTNESIIRADSLSIGEDGGFRVSFTNNGTLEVGTLELRGNKTLSGTVDADTIIFRGYGDTGFDTGDNGVSTFGENVKTDVLLVKTGILAEGTSAAATGFRVNSQSEVDSISKEIRVEANGVKTGLIVGAGNFDFSNLSIYLKDLTNDTAGDARMELLRGSETVFKDVYALQGKVLVQTNNGASTTIENLYVGEGSITNLQTYGTESDGKSSYNLTNIVIGDNAKLRLSVYGTNPAGSIDGKDISLTLGKDAIADFGGYKEDGDTSWKPQNIGFNAESLTVYVTDPSSSSVVYLSGVEGQVTTDSSKIQVVGASSANTGDSQVDLMRLSDVIQLNVKDDKGNVSENMSGQTLVQEANDLFDGATAVVGKNGELSNVQVVANQNVYGIAEMASVGLHIWRNEINDMNKRLGELRDSLEQSNGVWARVYNGRADFGSQNISNKYTAFQFGYDHQVARGVWLGGAVSYTDGNNDFANGGGDNSLLAFTAYGSWLSDNGFFVDVTGKVGRIKNTFDITMSDFASSGDYHTNAFSFSAEAGWRFHPTQVFFVEPQVELMYGRVNQVDYTTSTGLDVDQDAAQTLIGRAGFMLGLECPNDRGNAYIRASVLHDWKGDAEFSFSKSSGDARTLVEELGGTWYEYGIGMNFNATERTHIYADVEASSGGEVDTDYRVNLGIRYAW